MLELLQDEADWIASDQVENIYSSETQDKFVVGRIKKGIQENVLNDLNKNYSEMRLDSKGAFKDLLYQNMYALAADLGKMGDDKDIYEVCTITINEYILPHVYGLSLFTRRYNQVTATLCDL